MASYHSQTSDSVYIPSTHQITTSTLPPSDIDRIREWLPWSIVNIFIGWGLFSATPLIFTLLCRHNKRNNDLQGAKTMSTMALVFNIIVTLCGLAGWISLIILLVYARRMYIVFYPK